MHQIDKHSNILEQLVVLTHRMNTIAIVFIPRHLMLIIPTKFFEYRCEIKK